MSSGGMSVRALTSENVPSASLQWLEMLAPSPPANADSAPKPKGKAPTAKQSSYTVTVNAKTNAIIGNVQSPLSMVSVIGPARSGKSTLMNFLSGSKTELFATSPGAVTFTKGVYIPSKFLTLPEFSSLEGEPVIDATDSNVKITFVDTEGQGAVGQLYDMNLFSPALLCSQVVLYNRTGGLLTEEILNQLAMMTQAGQRLNLGQSITADSDAPISNATNGVDGANTATSKKAPFGHLVILFNRFQLSTVDDAATMSTSLLEAEDEIDQASENRNRIRQLLKACFQSVKVHILPDGYLKKEAQDAQRKDKNRFLTLADFEPEYLDYFKKLRTDLSQKLEKPRELVPGTPLTGGAIHDFVPSLAAAINAQEPLNVPNIFQASQNDAINKALNKFKSDLGKSLAELAQKDGKPSATLGREIDRDITLVLADMRSSLSYMSSDVLSKVEADATTQAQPMKNANLTLNLSKIQTTMKLKLSEITSALRTTVSTAFPDDKVLVAKADLDASFSTLQSNQINAYKTEGQSYDDHALPEDFAQVLQQAFDREKKVLDQRYVDSWQTWVDQQSKAQLDTLRSQLSQLATTVPAGDKKAFSAGLLATTERAKSDFNSVITSKYRGPDPKTQQGTFAAATDDVSKLVKATWEQNDSEITEQLTKKAKTCQAAYSQRLGAAIDPGQQPPSFRELTDSKPERSRLETFISEHKIGSATANEALDNFDAFVTNFATGFRKDWQSATAIFEADLQKKIQQNFDALVARLQDELDPISYTYSATVFAETVASKVKGVTNAYTTFKSGIGSLSAGSIAAGSMVEAERLIGKTISDIRLSKLRSFDDLASMFNRALLAKIVKPVIDTTMSDNETYTNVKSLDAALEKARDAFMSQKRELTLPDGMTADKQWEQFTKRTYDGLVENVRRNGEAYGYKANDRVPLELQKKIVDNIKDELANMANDLGFSYINSESFKDVGVQDKGMKDGADIYNLDKAATRALLLQNSPGHGFWGDRPTSLYFYDWALESSDYIIGKAVVTEMKPLGSLSQTYPAEPKDRPFTSTAQTQFTSTVSNSLQGNLTFGTKMVTEATVAGVKEGLEVSFGGGLQISSTNALTNTFSVTGSSTVTLPAGRVCTVTQVAFDQKTTIPYTARMKFVPKIKYQGGFIVDRGGRLKKQWFDNNKSENRVHKDFDLGRTDQIRDMAARNEDPFDWQKYKSEMGNNYDYFMSRLSDPGKYTFYVKGKWEGLSGKAVLMNVVPSQATLDLLPSDF